MGDAVARRRFERECAAMGLLAEHPHILTVFDAGFTSSRRAYLVMDLARRGSLADRLEREGSLPWQDVTALGIKMAGALETAHRAGILHRDVKPANILLTAYGEPQLADFGIARLAGEEHTRTGALAMSIAFAAPEVLDGRDATVLTDVYSLGATLFCLLRGEPPLSAPRTRASCPRSRASSPSPSPTCAPSASRPPRRRSWNAPWLRIPPGASPPARSSPSRCASCSASTASPSRPSSSAVPTASTALLRPAPSSRSLCLRLRAQRPRRHRTPRSCCRCGGGGTAPAVAARWGWSCSASWRC